MEMAQIIKYVMHTPYNTNPHILEDLLIQYTKEIEGTGGGYQPNPDDIIIYDGGRL